MELLTAAEMRAWDERAIAEFGIPQRVLMENAGRAAARVAMVLFPQGRVVGLVGKGNNGGDTVVLLRVLRGWGRDVAAVPVGGGSVPAELLHGWEIPVLDLEEAPLRGAGLLVDGILGTGATGAPRDPQAAAIRAINGSRVPVVALDGPSGVDLTDGSVAGEAVQADVTVSFGAPKRGLLFHPGRARAGRIIVVEIGFPPWREEATTAAVITGEWVRERMPQTAPNAHKGTMGKVAIVAGKPGMGGAPVMCAYSALRTGAGLVRVVSAAGNREVVHTAVPEAVFTDRLSDEVGPSLEEADSVVVGPGLGTEDDAAAVLREVLRRATGPILMDADALNLLARSPALLNPRLAGRVMITPHPGEMARLLDSGVETVVADPVAAAARAVERFGCVVLLKGAPSIVAAPGEPTLVNTLGHSGVATGGMGDNLSGICGALLARCDSVRDAAALGLHLSSRAADLAGRGIGLLPRDLAECLPDAIAEPVPPRRLDLPEVRLDLPPAR